jgi:cytochrome c oxidase assembly protein subunit 11
VGLDNVGRNKQPISILFSARRNKRGQLEPDAADGAVQQSMGFAGYEHAPKVEDRPTSAEVSIKS